MKSKAVELYEDVLQGSLKRFPSGFWTGDQNNGYTCSAEITRYLIEEVLKWDDEQLKTELSCKVFHKHKLKGMLCTIFNDSVYAAIENAYPGKFHEWEIACTPRNFWNRETAIEATIWLCREKLQMSDDQIRQAISRQFFVKNGFDTMMHVIYKNNAYEALLAAFPELFAVQTDEKTRRP